MNMRILLLLLLIQIGATASDSTTTFSGIITAGTGPMYNYETDRFKGRIYRVNPLIIHRNISAEIDVSLRQAEQRISPLVWGAIGYRILRIERMPQFWLVGSGLYSSHLHTDKSISSGEIKAPGMGFMMGMIGSWLPHCFANFSMQFYPTDHAIYKSMQVGWDFTTLGFSAGGTGIRVPEGRLYSAFLFSIRYSFGSEWKK